MNEDLRHAFQLCRQILTDPHLDLAQRFHEVDLVRAALAGDTLTWLVLGSFQVDAAVDAGIDLDRVHDWLLPMRQRAEEHLREHPGDLEVHELLSVVLVQLGDVAVRTAGAPAGRSLYLEALAGAQALAADNPGDPRWQRRLALAHSKIGNLAAEAGDPAEASAAFRESLRLAETMLATMPEVALDDIAVAYHKLAKLASRLGDPDEARAHAEAAREAAARRAELTPDDPDAQRSLSLAVEHLGDLALDAGDLETARRAYRDNFAIVESLVRSDPGHTGRHYDLAVCHQRLGMLAMAAGDLAAAHTEFTSSLALGERLAAEHPDELMFAAHLAAGYANLSLVAVRRADNTEAAALLALEATVLPSLIERDPGNPRWPDRLEESRRERENLRAAQASRSRSPRPGR